MSETSGNRNRRGAFASTWGILEKLRTHVLVSLSTLEILLGIAIALVITSLLVGYQFQAVPAYKVGDITERTIEAPFDFTIEDREATLRKKDDLLSTVPGVFDLDLGVNSRVETELRTAFEKARNFINQEKRGRGITSHSLPQSVQWDLRPQVAALLPRFNQDRVLEILLSHSFRAELEAQMIKLLQEALKYPGVVLSKDQLVLFQDRGIILRNSITSQDELLENWVAIKDLHQARSLLRHNQHELVDLSSEERKGIVAFLDNWVVPNISFNDVATADYEQLATRDVDPVLIQIKRGRTIVRAGDEIRARDLMLLDALRERKQPRRLVGEFVGIFLIVSFFLFALWHYFVYHQERHKQIRNHYLLVALVLTVGLVITKLFMLLADVVADSSLTESLQNPSHFYFFAPFALGALLIILLIDVNLAILYSLIFAVFAALLTGEASMFIYSLMGSWAAIYALDQYRERSVIVRAGMAIGLANVMTALALQLFQPHGGFQWEAFGIRAAGGLVSGLFAAMFASLLLPILESLFEITTDIKLLELSSLNKPLLRRLAIEAPGTYHHSIMVGTLAEAAAEAVGANALLARVGAYYHDIGKMKKPEYYVENQIYASNKHENLSPTMSSLIIASHVKDGLTMAGEVNLVPKVRDMIPQHHGTRLMTYFYQKAKDTADEKNQDVNENDFRYPGPKPQSKEAAILMLADQVEAAARTLQDPTPGQIRSMIRRLVQSTIQDGQFDECDVTMSELNGIAQAFERVITTMYHHRIEYPGFDFNKQGVERSSEERTEVSEKREPATHRIQ